MPTLFTKIYTGEIPGFVIAEDEYSFAILDKYPIQPGHVLIIPKEEIETVFALPPETYRRFFEFVRRVSDTLQKLTNAKRIGVVVEGFGVQDHAHLHLVPLYHGGQLNPYKGKEATDEELAKWQAKFKTAWEQASLF